MASSSSAAVGTRSALDPLSFEEIRRTVAIVRAEGRVPVRVQFVSVSNFEPARGEDVFGPRVAEVVLHDVEGRTAIELRVDLDAGRVVEWREVSGVEPQMTTDEFFAVEAAVRSAPEFQAALRRRGIEDPSLVDVDPVSAGFYGRPEEEEGRRLARFLAYVRPEEGGNAYARPLEGIFGLVDVRTGEFVFFEDRDPVPLPAETGEFRADRIALRDDVRPIEISQPEGPSFVVDGHEVRWQKWRLRVGFNTREGLVLHRVAYEDGDQLRPVLHRASYAEMVVPYADPDRFYQTPMDIGEFNIGTMTNSLELGCDCLGVIHYFDAAYVNASGEPVVVPNAICLHEEDDGLLWKHFDFRTEHTEVRRARRLVISTIATVGNYEYGFFWYLHQDGVISSEVKATGVLATQAVAENKPTPYGKLVAPHLNAIHHQHVFCARLDFDLDGGGNSVVETHTESIPQGPENPHGNAWITKSRVLATELEARRHIDPLAARSWTVVNPSKRNAVGEPVGYKLIPGENTLSFATEGCSSRRRAGFMDYHLWVTPYSRDERYPAGDYPYQHRGGEGLVKWVEANRPVDKQDIVVWYTMNHHHVPRPEDWPVMPVARIGFILKPWSFFDRNPALDVPPPSPGAASSRASGHCSSE
jgi:primary-amine oxidase